MKKVLKSSLSLFLAIAIIFGSAAVGLTEIDISGLFTVKASAASESDLTFMLNSDGESYSVYNCNFSASGSITIPSTYNGKPVTGIGDIAFSGRTSLTSINIPNSITSIGKYAFSDCTSLTSITIPDCVTSIGDCAFESCTSLTSITIGNGVTSIGYYAFENCTSLASVTIGDSVTSIGNDAFYRCTSLTSVNIPDSVTSIGWSAFGKCTSLKDVYITDIAAWCNISFGNSEATPMYYADNLYLNGELVTEVVFPDNKTRVGDYTFLGFTNLTSITIPNSVTSIGTRAFSWCTSLTSIEIPEGVTSIGEDAFLRCTSLKDVYITDIIAWCGIPFCNKTSNPLNNGANLYLNGELVADLVIPNSVTSIGDYALYGCTSLTYIEIPKGVTGIGNSAFSYCTNLTSITIPDTVISISVDAFFRCTSLTSITIPNSVTSIDTRAFYDCTSLTSITIGNGVTNIDYLAFDDTGYYNDESNWENDVLYVGEYLLKAKTSITGDYVVKDGTRIIADRAFDNCSNLSSIEIPDSITGIGKYAFSDCTSLTSITISDSITTIDGSVFYNTGYYNDESNWENDVLYVGKYLIEAKDSITGDYVVKEGTRIITDGAFSSCKYLTSITISDDVTTIGVQAFVDCTSLESIKFGNGLRKLDQAAFENCSRLKSITLPDSLTYIDKHVFYFCTGLETITIPKSITRVYGYAFVNCARLSTVYYQGLLSNWNNWDGVIIDGGNDALLNATIIHLCTCENWVIDTEATCTEDGSRHGNCKVCAESVSEVIPATGHTSSDWIDDANTSCTEAGSRHKECTACGMVLESDVISAPGHTASDWIIDRNASCTVSGSKHKECTVCGTTLATEVIPATGHTSSDWIIDTPATVSAPGSKHKECTVCGETLEIESIPKLEATKPATPKVATTNEIGGINITWNAVDGAVKYNVYRRQGGQTAWTLVGTTTGTSLLDKNVQSGIYYVYSVRAYNNAGLYSDFVSANTQTRKFMAVPKLKGISNATNGLYITWEPVAGVTNGYRVYRRGAGSTYWTYLGTTKNTYFTDTQVKNNSGEYFRYTVIADGGYHSKFDTTGLYLRRLSNPTLTSAVSSRTGITVKWKPVNGCLGYYVYRKTANSGWVRVGVVNGANASSFVDKTAQKGVTYTYTVRAVCGNVTSYFNSGISCKDKY